MKPKPNGKLNQKIQSFFQKRKAVSSSPKAILSKSDFDRNKLRMFWRGTSLKAQDAKTQITNPRQQSRACCGAGKTQNIKNKIKKAFGILEVSKLNLKKNFKFKILSFKSISNFKISKFKTSLVSFKIKALSNSNFIQNSKFKIQNLNPINFFKTFKIRIILTQLQKIKNRRYFVTGLKKAFAALTIVAVIVTAYWQNTPQAGAAILSP